MKRGSSFQVGSSAPSLVQPRHSPLYSQREPPNHFNSGIQAQRQLEMNLLMNRDNDYTCLMGSMWDSVTIGRKGPQCSTWPWVKCFLITAWPRASLSPLPTVQLNHFWVGRVFLSGPPRWPQSSGSGVKLLANFKLGNTYFISSLWQI